MPKAPTPPAHQPPATLPGTSAPAKLPATTLGALKDAARTITDQQVLLAFDAIAPAQATYVATGTYFGLLCIAKKAVLPHGTYQEWLQTVLSPKSDTRVTFATGKSYRTARRWAAVAESYLEIAVLGRAIHPKLAPTTTELWDPATDPDTLAGRDPLRHHLATILAPEHRDTLIESIANWIGPRSLQGILQDLNRADTAVLKEETTEADNAIGPAPKGTATRTKYQTEFDFVGRATAAAQDALEWRSLADETSPDAVAFWQDPVTAAELLRKQEAIYRDTADALAARLRKLPPAPRATPALEQSEIPASAAGNPFDPAKLLPDATGTH